MKITNQNIPPELALLYTTLISNNKNPVGGITTARTRRAATKKKMTKEERRQYEDMRFIAEYIADRIGLRADGAERRAFIFAEIQRLLDGTFNPLYWARCQRTAQAWFDSFPTNVDNNAGKVIRYRRPKGVPYTNTVPVERPRVYSFPDLTNLPSHVTYADGTPSSSPSKYTGGTALDHFRDTQWRWCRSVFRLLTNATQAGMPPTLFKSQNNITASADLRGTRGMFAMTYKAHFTGKGSTIPASTNPPLRPSWSSYWRYSIPTHPFLPYVAQVARRIVLSSKRAFKFDTGTIFNSAVIKSGVRPLQGIGYNNNRSITYQTQETLELWQVKPCLTGNQKLEFNVTGYYITPNAPSTTPTQVDSAFLEQHMYSVTGPFEARKAWPVTDTSGMTSPIYTGGTVSADPDEALPLTAGAVQVPIITASNSTGTIYPTGKAKPDADLFHFMYGEVWPWEPLDAAVPRDEDADNVYQFCTTWEDTAGKQGQIQLQIEPKYFYRLHTYVSAVDCQFTYPIPEANSSETQGEVMYSFDHAAAVTAAIARLAEITAPWANWELWHLIGGQNHECYLVKEGTQPPLYYEYIGTLPRWTGSITFPGHFTRYYDGFDTEAFPPYLGYSHGMMLARVEITPDTPDLLTYRTLQPWWDTSNLHTYSYTETESFREEYSTVITDEPIYFQS